MAEKQDDGVMAILAEARRAQNKAGWKTKQPRPEPIDYYPTGVAMARAARKLGAGPEFLELVKKSGIGDTWIGPRKPQRKKKNRGRTGSKAPDGFSLVERLMARTEPDRWYTHSQLLKLLPETNKDGLHGILYQKLPRLGLVERVAVLPDPVRPWTHPEEGQNSDRAALRPRYVYRIGADSAEMRALAREKDARRMSGRVEG